MTTIDPVRWCDLPALTLRGDCAAITIVPSSGARIVSLRSLVSNREWLWQPHDERSLALRPAGTPFHESPLTGIDECLPTIAPCRIESVDYPDHGEAWNRTWEIDHAALAHCEITTFLMLHIMRADFSRKITLHDSTVTFSYRL